MNNKQPVEDVKKWYHKEVVFNPTLYPNLYAIEVKKNQWMQRRY